MLDKLDAMTPKRAKFKPAFKRQLDKPNSEIKRGPGGVYHECDDCRPIGLPLQIYRGNKFHPDSGAKVVVLGAGKMRRRDWIDAIREVFEGDPNDFDIQRVDLCSDIRGVDTHEVMKALRCPRKRITRQEYGEPGDVEAFGHLATTLQRGAAQTFYLGLKPNQFRFYAKTLHRLKVELPALNKERARRGERALTFFEVYGYWPDEVVTRCERQMGDRETAKRWGVVKVGEIPMLLQCDPFENLRFVDDTAGNKEMRALDPTTQKAIRYLQMIAAQSGPDAALSIHRGDYAIGDPTRKAAQWWRKYEHLILDASRRVTRETLRDTFRGTLGLQLAA